MPVIGLDMRRRFFLKAVAMPLLANSRQQILDLFTEMASALSEGNSIAFMEAFDRSIPSYEQIRANVTALTEQDEVLSSIELLGEEGDDRRRSVELDWFLQIRNRQNTGPVERRRERVKCRLELRKKRWKIVSLEPVRFFAPARV